MARIPTAGTRSCGQVARWRRGTRTAALNVQLDDLLVWDNHTYTTPSPGTRSIEELRWHLAVGFDVAFLNIGDADRRRRDRDRWRTGHV